MNDLILEVHVRGKPMPTIKWFLDGLIIKEDTGKFFSLRRPDGVFQLCIHDPQVKDSGRYSVEAENVAGKEVLKHYLRVQPRTEYLSPYEHGIKKADPRRKYEEELEEERRQLEEQEAERRRVCRIALAIKAAELAEKLRLEEEEAARIAAEAEREARHERGEFTPEPEEEEFDWGAGQTYDTYETTEEPEAEAEPEEPAEAAEVVPSQPQSQTASRKQSVVPAQEKAEPPSEEPVKEPTPPAASEPAKEPTPPAASEPVKDPTPPAPVPASAKATPRASASPARSVASVGSKASDAALNSDGEPAAEGEEGEEVKPKKKLRLREKIFLPPKPVLASEQEVDPKKLLSFIVKMKDATVVEGIPVKLICSVDGPRPDIKWFKNNIPLVYNKHCKNQTTQTMGAVYFAHILPEDAGVYSCVVKNNFCEISTSGTVVVIPSPKDKVFPPSFTRNMIGQ
jgi:Immunoglobulin I-set domain